MRSIFATIKLKAVALLVIFAAAVALATSSTIAFFTDSRESTGVFTVGSVYIDLTESAVVADSAGNLVADTTKDRISGAEISNNAIPVIHNYGIVFPGQTIHKDPIVKNVGKDSAWIAIKVIIEDGTGDIHKLFGYNDYYDDIDIEHLLSGGLLDQSIRVGEWCGIPDVCYNDNYAMVQASSRAQGKYEFFFLIQKPLTSGESLLVFDTLEIDSTFGNKEMQELRELKVTVQAFAVQQFGFTSCLEAMTAAFPDRFITCVQN